MSEYLVRWKFGAGSFLNASIVDTEWYQSIHPDKEGAVEHYTKLLYNSSPAMKLTVEIFEMVELFPGETEPMALLETLEKLEGMEEMEEEGDIPDSIKNLVAEVEQLDRNSRIMKLHEKGYSNREIATAMGLSYQTVYGVVRKETK